MPLTSILSFAATVIAGMAAWTLAEYLMHRFAMHELRGRGLASREHLKHHGSKDSILEKWALSWSGVVAVGVFVMFPIGGLALAIGWIGGYGYYDLLHWRAHRRAPRHAYARWVRKNHFFHHFHAPMKNHGVTTPVWDIVFGTHVKVDVVRVPRRLALTWLLDDDGNVKPEHADDYVLAGRRPLDAAQQSEDLDRAFANLAPLAT